MCYKTWDQRFVGLRTIVANTYFPFSKDSCHELATLKTVFGLRELPVHTPASNFSFAV